MSAKDFIFTSESVGEGHPDKMADQISDAFLDAHIKSDVLSRVACETLVKNQVVVLAGEVTSKASVDYDSLVRRVVKQIGYCGPEAGFDFRSFELITLISKQSTDISMGVTEGEGKFKEQGAGDQGLMFGFACDETPEFMPLPIALAHKLMIELSSQRKSGKVGFILPDAKCQVSVRYGDSRPAAVDTIVLSTQHTPEINLQDLEQYVVESVIKKVIPAQYLSPQTHYFINPTGRFVIGGPVGDAGLTGRKIIVDSYGGYSRHGGGAFSGKDPSKVDRSAAYMARYAAKNVVAAGLAAKCEVQVAYAIGVAKPVSLMVNTFGTGKIADEKIAALVAEHFDLRPKGIVQSLDLLRPIYSKTAAYGHFGREEPEFTWEWTDKADALRAAAGL